MTDLAPPLAALLLGLISSAHCVGMCGGIMGALSLGVAAGDKAGRMRLLLGYNLGRIASYSLMGAVAGLLAGTLAAVGGAQWLRLLAGLLLLAMALYLAQWWRGLVYLENLGRYLWAYVQPLGKGLLPVTSLRQALLLGAIWGWLPCGLVYTALAYAMAQADWVGAASVMLAFGLGTLPAVLATGLLAQSFARLLQARALRLGFALLLAAFGMWTILGSWGHDHHTGDRHTPHHHSPETVTPDASGENQVPDGHPHPAADHHHHH